jgi:ABC-2 type transport system ATP-binding protein
LQVTLRPGIEDYSQLSADLIGAGFKLKRFSEKETNLESAFMALTKGSGSKI